jgi:hypothetical protein
MVVIKLTTIIADEQNADSDANVLAARNRGYPHYKFVSFVCCSSR